MGAKRRQFTVEFKREAVRLANDSGKPLAQMGRLRLTGRVQDVLATLEEDEDATTSPRITRHVIDTTAVARDTDETSPQSQARHLNRNRRTARHMTHVASGTNTQW